MRRLRDDTVREVRALKGWISLLALLVLLALQPLYIFLLRLSLLQSLILFIIGLTLATVFIELAARYGYRLRRHSALPGILGIHLAGIWDMAEASQAAANWIGRWLRPKAAVIAWLEEDGQELTPAAVFGLPEAWRERASPLAMGQRSLKEALYQGQVIVKPSPKGDPWFGSFKSDDEVIYVPLLSRHRVVGVLALVGDGRAPELRDRKLLSDLGIVLALSLDNCRLYAAEHQRAQQMQALARLKSDFLITVSHELRTPLTSIRTAAEILLEEEEREERDSPRARLARNIVKGANRLTALVADLADMSRQGDPTPRLELEGISAAEVVSNALAQVYPLFQAKRQTLEFHIGSPGPAIVVDRRRFEQVIVNLLSNAHRYTPSEGRIAVDVRETGNEVVISVSDSGPGIPEKERESIFEPFYRGERGGMGLGLAIAKSLAELHGGRIWVESSEGEGSTFLVAVPRARQTEAAPQLAARSRRGRSH